MSTSGQHRRHHKIGIVGGGSAGISVAARLRRAGVRRHRACAAAGVGGRPGPVAVGAGAPCLTCRAAAAGATGAAVLRGPPAGPPRRAAAPVTRPRTRQSTCPVRPRPEAHPLAPAFNLNPDPATGPSTARDVLIIPMSGSRGRRLAPDGRARFWYCPNEPSPSRLRCRLSADLATRSGPAAWQTGSCRRVGLA
jgi:hypothetical protein